MRIKLLGSTAVALTVASMSAPPTSAYPRFWTDSTKTTPLRDLNTPPKRVPDVLEFANQGPVTFSMQLSTGADTVACDEVDLGAAVVVNDGVEETMLSVPFGVFEGDRCIGSGGAVVPARFHTLPPWLGVGAVGTGLKVTKITVTGSAAPFAATIHYLPISLDLGDKLCRWALEQTSGQIENATEGFVEEAPPNLSLKFSAVHVAVKNMTGSKGCPTSGTFSGEFVLETMSTATDTAFVG
jgi:hypothetical protein